MKRVAIIGATLSGNHGAEAMLVTTIGRIRDEYPDARFFVYSYYPAEDRALVSDPAITVHSSTPAHLVTALFPGALVLGAFRALGLSGMGRIMPSSARDLAECDALVDLAGVSFVAGREKYLPFNILTIWPAMRLHVPVVKLAQAMGPFTGTLNRTAARRFLSRCARVFARGAGTSRHLETLSLPDGVAADAADVVFLYEDRYSLTTEGDDEAATILETLADTKADDDAGLARTIVGICPSSVVLRKAESTGWDYVGLLAGLATRLAEHGSSVVLFPNATRSTSVKMRNNDLPVIEAIFERLDERARASVVAVRGDMSARNIKSLVAGCDAVVVSRFHAMIGALASAVPVAVIGWSHKYVEVMEQFDLADYVLDHSECTAETVEAVVTRLLETRETICTRIGERLAPVRESSAAQFEYLLGLLESTRER